MKITALSENTCLNDSMAVEHGLSLYIETNDKKILFDSGCSSIFYENAIKTGIDLSKVDFAVISHGHNDHGGGIAKFLSINDTADVYISENAFKDFFSIREENPIYIGLDKTLLKSKRIKKLKTDTTLFDGIKIISEINLKYPKPISNSNLYVKIDDKFVHDNFNHEQSLLITENGKTVLFAGCSHNGILNITKSLDADFVIGGFHMLNLTEETHDGVRELNFLASGLLKNKAVYYTCHCTGLFAYNYLKKIMKDRLMYLSCGETLEI